MLKIALLILLSFTVASSAAGCREAPAGPGGAERKAAPIPPSKEVDALAALEKDPSLLRGSSRKGTLGPSPPEASQVVGYVTWTFADARYAAVIGEEETVERPGGVFILIDVEARLEGTADALADKGQIRLIDDLGRGYFASGRSYALGEQGFFSVPDDKEERIEMPPTRRLTESETNKGVLAFDVPKGSTGFQLRVSDIRDWEFVDEDEPSKVRRFSKDKGLFSAPALPE